MAETVAAGGVDKVLWFGELGEAPVEAYATAVADAIAAEPGVVFGGRHPSERVLLGAAAARLQAPVLTGAHSVSSEGDDVVVAHSVFGGIAECIAVSGVVALVLDGGSVPSASSAAPIEEVAATPLGMRVIETKASAFEQVDLGATPRVVGIGRGLKAQGDLRHDRELRRGRQGRDRMLAPWPRA